jgi:hypothetical protein
MTAFKKENHRFDGKIAGKTYCTKCGLIFLNNKFTEWAVAKGCNNEDSPEYERARKRLS